MLDEKGDNLRSYGVLCVGYDHKMDAIIKELFDQNISVFIYDDISDAGDWKIDVDPRVIKINGKYDDYDLIETLILEYSIKDVYFFANSLALLQMLKAIKGLVFR